MEKISILSHPKYAHIRNAFEIFDKRVKTLQARRALITLQHNVDYLTKMQIIRNRVIELLKTHKSYKKLDIFIRKSDPIYGEISIESLKALAELSKPRKGHLIAALKKVNQMIRVIKNDYYYENNSRKVKRIAELMEHRRTICCLLADFKHHESQTCYRFAPCEIKIINIYEIPKENKPNSRILKFEHDISTNNLAHPNLRKIRHALYFFKMQKYFNSQKLNKSFITQREMDRIILNLKNLDDKINFLQKLFKELNVEDIKKTSNGGSEKRIALSDDTFKLLAYPPRKKLEHSLTFHELYLTQFQKNGQEFKNRNGIRPFTERIKRNISFINKMLELIPQEKQHCKFQDSNGKRSKIKTIKRLQNDSGHFIGYDFDEKTNQLAFPKIHILQTAFETNMNFLKGYEGDIKNITTYKKGEKNLNPSAEYEILEKHLNNLKALISKRQELVNFPESVHNKCLISNSSVYPPTKYKMLEPYKSVISSQPATKFVFSSLRTYENWIARRINDVKYKKELHLLLAKLASISPLADTEKTLNHTNRMIKNKLQLENFLEKLFLKNDKNTEVQNNLDDKDGSDIEKKKQSKPNMKRLKQMAKPKVFLLKHTITNFSNMMSESKMKRLECALFLKLKKPEQVEESLRQHNSNKERLKSKSKSKRSTMLNKLFYKTFLQKNSNNADEIIKHAMFYTLIKINSE